ncbi:MAG: hypothetical protein M1815_000525 [Lichina confinis]|nr:MAG: hypothetical protein M1815_000525 [Lichina confinis]
MQHEKEPSSTAQPPSPHSDASVSADPFESTSDQRHDSDSSEEEERDADVQLHRAATEPSRHAQAGSSNPFRTSAASRCKRHSMVPEALSTQRPKDLTRSRTSLDVDAFKRLIMTGTAEGASSAHGRHGKTQPGFSAAALSGDNGSIITDASSISRQSIFESVPEGQPDTPRTSHELSVSEDERRHLGDGLVQGSERARPRLPAHRHGKPVTVQASEGGMSGIARGVSSSARATLDTTEARPNVVAASPLGTLTDLDKPLPPPPLSMQKAAIPMDDHRASMAKDISSPPSTSPSRRIPPQPPISRHRSQLSTQRPKPRHELNDGQLQSPSGIPSVETGHERSITTEVPPSKKAPRPPPARRPGLDRGRSSSTASHVSIEQRTSRNVSAAENTTEGSSLPAPDITGFPSLARASSSASHVKRRSSGAQSNTTLRSSTIGPPPPPPPPRRNRGFSRGSIESTTSFTSHHPQREPAEDAKGSAGRDTDTMTSSPSDPPIQMGSPLTHASTSYDAMADLNSLQQEVDELCGKFARRTTT